LLDKFVLTAEEVIAILAASDMHAVEARLADSNLSR
jgi:hypothetical protein